MPRILLLALVWLVVAAAPAGAAVPRERLAAMGRAVAHRGPDGAHDHVAGDVGFHHARLAIIDLATGDQPLHDGVAEGSAA